MTFEPRMPRAKMPQLMAAQYTLLALANDQPLQVPGKVYEYLASGRRILACTEHNSATAGILSSLPGCAIAESSAGVASSLERWWVEYCEGQSAYIDRTALLASMTYRRRAEDLAVLLHGMAP